MGNWLYTLGWVYETKLKKVLTPIKYLIKKPPYSLTFASKKLNEIEIIW